MCKNEREPDKYNSESAVVHENEDVIDVPHRNLVFYVHASTAEWVMENRDDYIKKQDDFKLTDAKFVSTLVSEFVDAVHNNDGRLRNEKNKMDFQKIKMTILDSNLVNPK